MTDAPGVDDVRGLSVHSIVLQVPTADLSQSHTSINVQTDPNAVIGVYASASRKKTRVLDDDGSSDDDNGQWVQVSRLGEPLINEVLIPMGRKDRWNAPTLRMTGTSGSFTWLPSRPA